MIQLTLVKITGYGPWTLTLGSDREHQLQMLQASLYKKVEELFSEKNCLVFFNRFDELFSVTNSLGLLEHVDIQNKLKETFSLDFTIAVGSGYTPLDANKEISKAQVSNSKIDKNYDILGNTVGSDGQVQISHIDIDSVSEFADRNTPYEVSATIFQMYSEMSNYFLKKGALTFFMGGDNFMIVADQLDQNYIQQFLDKTKQNYGVQLNCGIGSAETARKAASLATKSLDKVRDLRNNGQSQRILELNC